MDDSCEACNHQGWIVVGLYPPPPLVRAPGKVVHDWNLTQNKQQGREGGRECVRACVHACVRASVFFLGALPTTKALKDIVLRFIIEEYSSLRDFYRPLLGNNNIRSIFLI